MVATLPDLPRREREQVFEALDADAFVNGRHGELFRAWRAVHRATTGPIRVDQLDVDDDLRAFAADLHRREATLEGVTRFVRVLVDAVDRRRLRDLLAETHHALASPTVDAADVLADLRTAIGATA